MKINDVWLNRLKHEYEIASSYMEGQEIRQKRETLVNYNVGYDLLFGFIRFIDFLESDIVGNVLISELEKDKEKIIAEWDCKTEIFESDLSDIADGISTFYAGLDMDDENIQPDMRERLEKGVNARKENSQTFIISDSDDPEFEWDEIEMNGWQEIQSPIHKKVENAKSLLKEADLIIRSLFGDTRPIHPNVHSRTPQINKLQQYCEGLENRVQLTYRQTCHMWLNSGYYAFVQLKRAKRIVEGKIYYEENIGENGRKIMNAQRIEDIVCPPWQELIDYCAPRYVRGRKHESTSWKGTRDANNVPIIEKQLVS